MLHILLAFAQYERDVNRERTIAGMAEAKRRGKVLGNPTKIHGELKLAIMVDIWNPELTNQQIMTRNGYKSVATLHLHFQGERGQMIAAKKLTQKEFDKARIKRLEEVAKQEHVPVRRLKQIIKQKAAISLRKEAVT